MPTIDLQERFLSTARKTQLNVTVFLMNGYQIRGQIAGHDSYLVFLNAEGKQNVIYKHAISTIIPEKPVDLTERGQD